MWPFGSQLASKMTHAADIALSDVGERVSQFFLSIYDSEGLFSIIYYNKLQYTRERCYG